MTYTLCSAVQWCRLFRFQLREMSALRQAKCGYLVWIPKMRNHQLFLRERQEAIFAHIQGNWKSSKAMKVFICGQAAISADRPKLLTQCALCTQSDEGRSWSILQVLQNTDQSFKICKFGSICKFATPARASTIGNSPSLKTLLSPNSSRCTFFTILCGSRDSGRLALYNAQLLNYHVLKSLLSLWFCKLCNNPFIFMNVYEQNTHFEGFPWKSFTLNYQNK